MGPSAGTNFEVTTLRIDSPSSDGRRPNDVTFTKDWQLDAERRDLTINSMFLSFDGIVHDYFKGFADLKNKHIAFVGNPEKRIQEDYLRILRYFRFYGRISDQPDNHQDVTLAAIKDNVSGMEYISGERVWSELKRILTGNHAVAIARTMQEVGLNRHMGLPDNETGLNLLEMDSVLARAKSNGFQLSHATILASMLHSQDELLTVHARLKMSNMERDTALLILEKRSELGDDLTLQTVKCWWVDSKNKSREAAHKVIQEAIKYAGNHKLLQEFEAETFPWFPVSGTDIKELGLPPGPAYGIMMNKFKEEWKASNFQLGKEQLLDMAPNLTEQVLQEAMEEKQRQRMKMKAGKKRKNSE